MYDKQMEKYVLRYIHSIHNSWVKEQITIEINYLELIAKYATKYQNLRDIARAPPKRKFITFNRLFNVIK